MQYNHKIKNTAACTPKTSNTTTASKHCSLHLKNKQYNHSIKTLQLAPQKQAIQPQHQITAACTSKTSNTTTTSKTLQLAQLQSNEKTLRKVRHREKGK